MPDRALSAWDSCGGWRGWRMLDTYLSPAALGAPAARSGRQHHPGHAQPDPLGLSADRLRPRFWTEDERRKTNDRRLSSFVLRPSSFVKLGSDLVVEPQRQVVVPFLAKIAPAAIISAVVTRRQRCAGL